MRRAPSSSSRSLSFSTGASTRRLEKLPPAFYSASPAPLADSFLGLRYAPGFATLRAALELYAVLYRAAPQFIRTLRSTAVRQTDSAKRAYASRLSASFPFERGLFLILSCLLALAPFTALLPRRQPSPTRDSYLDQPTSHHWQISTHFPASLFDLSKHRDYRGLSSLPASISHRLLDALLVR